VDTSYIDYRTADPDRLEGRRTSELGEASPADNLLAAAGSAATSAAASKTEDGKWQVDMTYINHRTGDCDRLEGRRGASDATAPLGSAALATGPSSTVKKASDGKWIVDTAYIGHRTMDTANLTRKEELLANQSYADPAEKKYPYAELKGQRPDDVDPSRKELYIAPDEFETVMGMTPAAFDKMPKWKQQNLKKAKDIF